ncbi:MAG: hypothetical protein IT379_28245, partial [Deltaproteobacteria bacterium]|nr:hypothetical protein [Deltaproteobacteria bacterium]
MVARETALVASLGATLPERLRQIHHLSHDDRVTLLRAWVEGRLEPLLLDDPPSTDATTALRQRLARSLGTLDSVIAWRGPGPGETEARRWCWIAPWVLLEQDEDLFLMRDDLIEPLLDEARASCTKRDYAVGIVTHHLRDSIHAALREGADALRARIAATRRFADAARRARATGLVEYLARIADYERPQKVSRDDAMARVSDVWRCHAPTSVVIETRGDEWWSPLETAGTR